MKDITIEIADKEYIVHVAETEEEKSIGFSGTPQINENEGMLFDYSSDLQDSLVFNTLEMEVPIDIIFINDDDEVVAVEYGEPKSEELIECTADDGEKLKYVLEVNANSGIKIGDELDIKDEEENDEISKMYVLGPDGEPQGVIVAGSRIYSRIHTRGLIKRAKKASKSKNDSDYKKLGLYMFKILDIQNNQSPEYVSLEIEKGE